MGGQRGQVRPVCDPLAVRLTAIINEKNFERHVSFLRRIGVISWYTKTG
jgi:hypothetical protein